MPGPLETAAVEPRLSNSTHAQRLATAISISGPSAAEVAIDRQIPDLDAAVDTFLRRIQNETVPPFAFAAGECLNASQCLAPIFTEATGIRAWPTLGQLWRNGEPVFYFSEVDARRLASSEAKLTDFQTAPGRYPFHAWITLETGDIFDPTILATTKVHVPDACRPGAIAVGRPETVLAQHTYVPLLLGRDIFTRILGEADIPRFVVL